jgi:two-component system OmpR family sensor kinase
VTDDHRTPISRLLAGTRTRILLAFVVLLTFSTTLSVIAIRQLFLVRTSDRVDAALSQEVEEFRRLVRGNDPSTGAPFAGDLAAIFDTYLDRNVPGPGETVVAIVDGRLYAQRSSERGGSPAIEPLAARWARLTETERGEADTDAGEVRYVAVPITGQAVRGTFVVIAALEAERDEVADAVRVAAIVLISVLLIASALAWVLAGRILAPLHELRDTARAITQSDLTRRIPVTGTDEIAELARTFNAMLDRLEESFASLESAFASQRAFVSDASHELRTPITIVRGHLELLGDDPEERRETVSLVTDELDRMSRFVDDLLLLAKAERDDFLHLGPLELGALTDEMFEKATGLGRRSWLLAGRAEGLLVADRQRLTQAVMGLAQNAVQHTQDGDPVWIGSAVDRGEARLFVRDIGPGIPPADQERIFERFARASASARRSEGAGLGLSIVRAIAEAHGGRVELASDVGAGSTFAVVVPLEGAPPLAGLEPERALL